MEGDAIVGVSSDDDDDHMKTADAKNEFCVCGQRATI